MATANNAGNIYFVNNADGFTVGGGTTQRNATFSGADQTFAGAGTNVYTFPNRTMTVSPFMTNQSTADQTINAATTALLTGSQIAVPTDKLAVGTRFRWVLSVSKTAAGTAANSFLVKVGTAGTTADTTVLTFSTGTATGVVDTALITIDVVVRGPLTSSGIFQGHFNLSHNLSATGFSNVANLNIKATSAAFDVTTANLFVSLACTTAASTVLTFSIVYGTATNL